MGNMLETQSKAESVTLKQTVVATLENHRGLKIIEENLMSPGTSCAAQRPDGAKASALRAGASQQSDSTTRLRHGFRHVRRKWRGPARTHPEKPPFGKRRLCSRRFNEAEPSQTANTRPRAQCLRLAVSLAVEHGASKREILALHWDDIDFSEKPHNEQENFGADTKPKKGFTTYIVNPLNFWWSWTELN